MTAIENRGATDQSRTQGEYVVDRIVLHLEGSGDMKCVFKL